MYIVGCKNLAMSCSCSVFPLNIVNDESLNENNLLTYKKYML